MKWNDLHLRPRVESITDDNVESNCSMIENIPPKGVIESNFICTLAMSAEDWFDFYCNTKLSESSDMTKHWVIHYYSVLQISFIQKCCGN